MTEQAQEVTPNEDGLIGNEEEGVVVGAPKKDEAEDTADTKAPERPEWLPEKFGKPDEMAKAYIELEAKLREKGKLAPEEYSMAAELAETIDTDADAFKEFQGIAKEAGLTNDAFNKMVDFAKAAGLILPKDAFTHEMEELGSDAEKIIGNIKAFSSQNLTEAEQHTLGTMAFTADQVRVMDKLIRMTGAKPIPSNAGSSVGEDVSSLKSKLAKLNSNPDIKYNRELQKEAISLAEAIANS